MSASRVAFIVQHEVCLMSASQTWAGQVDQSNVQQSLQLLNGPSCCVWQVDAHGHCCQHWALAWQYRKQNLLKELLTYKADILCLQASNYCSLVLPHVCIAAGQHWVKAFEIHSV